LKDSINDKEIQLEILESKCKILLLELENLRKSNKIYCDDDAIFKPSLFFESEERKNNTEMNSKKNFERKLEFSIKDQPVKRLKFSN